MSSTRETSAGCSSGEDTSASVEAACSCPFSLSLKKEQETSKKQHNNIVKIAAGTKTFFDDFIFFKFFPLYLFYNLKDYWFIIIILKYKKLKL
jgi:hypothetical protein